MSDRRTSKPEKQSKTQRKREMHQLQDWGHRLVNLNDSTFRQLKLPVGLSDAVIACRAIRAHEARRRQLQLIGRLMREMEAHEQNEVIQQIRKLSPRIAGESGKLSAK